MDNDFKKIIDNYGLLNQLKHFQTEVYELTEAIFDYEYTDMYGIEELEKHLKEHITEELADNLNFLRQFQLYYGISNEDIENVRQFKNKRQLERMEKE
jgi:NTP pyrophosphatase (non-canonical NTP hydrolase)